MSTVAFFLGLLLLALEVFATWKNRGIFRRATSVDRWCHFYRWRYGGGAVLAIASVFVSYPMHVNGERYRIIGLPFPAAAFDSGGADFVGPLTVPFLLANGLVWLLLPDLLLWCWSAVKKISVAQGA